MSRVGYFYRVDESNDGVLSKSLTGNSFNGKPVGFLEFANDYSKRLESYNKKYELGLTDEIKKFVTWQWVDRLSKLSEAKMLTSENNLEYLPIAIDTTIAKYRATEELVSKKERRIQALKDEQRLLRQQIDGLQSENRNLKNKIRSFKSIKRSARLLLGNIKRKVKDVIK